MIFLQLQQQLHQLKELLIIIDNDAYTYKCKYLSNASIGGHTRHIIELFNCALNGLQTGKVDYINRERNLVLETNKFIALQAIEDLKNTRPQNDKLLQLVAEGNAKISTTFYREMVYNIEHIIHHLALIKVSLIEQGLDIVEENFGMAYSTIQYKQNLQTS